MTLLQVCCITVKKGLEHTLFVLYLSLPLLFYGNLIRLQAALSKLFQVTASNIYKLQLWCAFEQGKNGLCALKVWRKRQKQKN